MSEKFTYEVCDNHSSFYYSNDPAKLIKRFPDCKLKRIEAHGYVTNTQNLSYGNFPEKFIKISFNCDDFVCTEYLFDCQNRTLLMRDIYSIEKCMLDDTEESVPVRIPNCINISFKDNEHQVDLF